MRSAEFDKQQVLRAAIGVFATKGYSQTSMQDLKEATGLHPGSIYCAFENKQGLLLSALQQYAEDRGAEFTQLFDNAPSMRVGLKAYLDKTLSDITSNGHQSVCLSQKALSEMGQVDEVVNLQLRDNMQAWQDGFVEMFEKAIASGEIPSTRNAAQRARFFVLGIYGLRTYGQTDISVDALNELCEQLLEDVCR